MEKSATIDDAEISGHVDCLAKFDELFFCYSTAALFSPSLPWFES
jgi:hypothetical protein